MKRTEFFLVLLVSILAYPLAVAGQDNSETAVAEAKDEAIEEITVYGEKSISALRQAVYRAEEDFYSIFSALNDDDDYDIRCFYETPTGTRLRNHVCRAKFVTDAYSADARRWRTDGPRSPTRDPEAVIAQKSVELQRKMETLIATNPDLLAALERYTLAQDRFKSERKSR